MNPRQIGRAARALGRRRGWRQEDLAVRLGISQAAASAVETGRLGEVSAETLGRLFAELGADLVMTVRWRGGELDRLLDEAHARLVERISRRLAELGWEVFVEVSFARYGERGSVDVLGWDPATRTVLIVEVKSDLAAVEETLRRHDAKVRLAPHIAFERLGERPAVVARLLVLPDTTTTRRRIADHAVTFDRAYPRRGREVTRWLAHPSGPMAGLLLVRDRTATPARRVRCRADPTARARAAGSRAGNAPDISQG